MLYILESILFLVAVWYIYDSRRWARWLAVLCFLVAAVSELVAAVREMS